MNQLVMFDDVDGVEFREIMCKCGCGTQFYQPRVGRARQYLNNQHKEKAYRQKAKEAKERGDELMAFAEWMGGVADALAQGAKWEGVDESTIELMALFAGKRGAGMFNALYDAISLFRGK